MLYYFLFAGLVQEQMSEVQARKQDVKYLFLIHEKLHSLQCLYFRPTL